MRFEIKRLKGTKSAKYFVAAYDRAGHYLFGFHTDYDRPSKAVSAIKALSEQAKRARIVYS